ncbi:hypothetical protein VE03_10356 [Pseudogymnoascus sp. 23342-1-I1]|nr:hypothetical protein VE03_10356 [Pseudogymnoascus sp. 23342-1-I1]
MQAKANDFFSFESREICEEIIGSYHGQPVGEEGLLLQFRITEYKVSAYGSPVDIANISPPMSSAGVSCIAQISGHLPQLKGAGSWKRNGSSSDKTGFNLDTRIAQTILTPRKQDDPERQLMRALLSIVYLQFGFDATLAQ